MKSLNISVRIFCTLISTLLLSSNTFAAFNTSRTFTKDLTKVCPRNLTQTEKAQVYSRIGNIGASFSHGCIQCEVLDPMRSAFENSNDEIWLRRNYLLHFLSENLDLDKSGAVREFIVTEDDPNYDIESIHGSSVNDYDGRWYFNLENDNARVLPKAIRRNIIDNPSFKDEGAALFGPLKGIIYQAISRNVESNDTSNYVLIDFASDGARSFEMLKNHGDEELFTTLAKDGWNNEEDRERLIELTVKRIENQQPSVLFLTDTLFWDTIPRALHYAKEKGMNSALLNILNNPILTNKIKHTRFYGEEQEKRMHDDFFEVIARISRGHYKGREIPVVMARLIDNPAAKFVKTGLGVDFARIISSVIYQVSGIKVADTLIANFAALSVKDLGYDENAEMSEVTVNELNSRQKQIIESIMSQDASLPAKAISRLSGPILAQVNRSLPILMQSIDKSFAHMNFLAREISSQKNNNITLVSADRFFLNIHNLLHPGTIHPHIEGSKEMADLVEDATCVPHIERTDARQYKFLDDKENYIRFESKRSEIYQVLETLVFEKEARTIKMNQTRFDVDPQGWTRKNGITTLKGSLKTNNVFTRDYRFDFEISYYDNEIISSSWTDSGDSIARQGALRWLDSISYHLPEYLVY